MPTTRRHVLGTAVAGAALVPAQGIVPAPLHGRPRSGPEQHRAAPRPERRHALATEIVLKLAID